ncbi:MAG: carboxypeptidase-like regulatory domain-containing protein [Planctomycetota bacterium]
MRPLAVLALVLAAIAALAFAYFSITGDSSRDDAQVSNVVRPAMEPEEAQRRADAELVEASGGAEVEEVTRTAVGPEEVLGSFANRLHGKVVSPAGIAVPDARVSVFRKRAPAHLEALTIMFQNGPQDKVLKTTRTNERGEYEFKALPPGKDHLVVVEHEDYQRTEVGPIEMGEESQVREDIELREGFQLFGYVRDHGTGLPIEGALITLDNPLAAQLPSDRKSPDRMQTKSEPDGRYEFRHVAPGTKWLMCQAESYGTVVVNNVTFLGQGQVDRHKSQDIQMKPEMTISGQVIGPDRVGVEGASVEGISYNAEALSRGNAKTDAMGNFVIRGLAEAQYSVVARAEGFGEKRLVRVDAGAQGIELELAELGGVMGRVVDASTGRALSDFKVAVRMVNLSSTFVGRVAAAQNFRGANNGAFHVPGLAHGHYVVEVSAKGYANTRSERFTVNQGITVPDVMVQMTRGGRILGQVVDGYTAKPISGAVVATQDNNWVESPFTNVFKGLVSRTTTEASARTDENGQFEFELLTPGAYQVTINHQKYTAQIMNDVQVFEGQEREIGVIKLFTGGQTSGTAFLADGSKAVGASVSLHPTDGSGRSYEARTNSEGHYRITNVAPGSYKLSLSRPDLREANPFQVIVDMKQSEIEIAVADGGEYKHDLYLGSD